MKPSYRKEKDNDYMILEAPGKPEGGEYQIRMLLVNPIYGLLPCKMRMVDGSRAFYYDITEKQPMTSVFERRLMGKEDIEKLLGGLEKAMDEAGRYLLVMEQFIFFRIRRQENSFSAICLFMMEVWKRISGSWRNTS